MDKNLQSFFHKSIKNSFVPVIMLFAVGYYIANVVEISILERIPLFFYPQKTLLIFLFYIFLWIIFCFIRATLALRKQVQKMKNAKVEDKS